MERDLWGRPVPAETPRPNDLETPPHALRTTRAADKEAAEHFRHFRALEYLPPPATDEETNFRHSGWAARRHAVKLSLMRTEAPESRRERFSCCGSGCVVERSPSTGRLRVSANYCHDRLCQPCGSARSRLIAGNLVRFIEGRPTRFITLTLKHNSERLSNQITRLFTCFRRLRDSVLWRDAVAGGAAFLEVKRAKDGRSWHPHLHLITEGRYLPHSALSANWLAITGDSFVVDIRAVADTGAIASYVAKYASKPIDASIYHQPEALDEALLALRGRHLCTTFGTWRGFKLEEKGDDPGDWQPVTSLNRLEAARRDGEPWAIALWSQLKHVDYDEARLPAPGVPP